MDSALEWKALMSDRRLRDLLGGPKSSRIDDELRDEFERDYGRTVYSTPFRRLRDKAQVFPLEAHDGVRTRLMHSHEVSSVAEDLARQAARTVILTDTKYLSRIAADQAQKLASAVSLVAATCGLVHDLGNPPFGHAGELAISSWFEEKLEDDKHFFDSIGGEHSQQACDFLKFEGNAHTIRILGNMYLLADNFGLNLTSATLSAAGKYIAASHEAGKEHQKQELLKPGYFSSEQRVVEQVRRETSTLGVRHPITYLVEAADDIVYCVVDLEDGVKKGVLDWNVVRSDLERLASDDEVLKQCLKEVHRQVGKTGLAGRALAEASAHSFRIWAISMMVQKTLQAFKERYHQIMAGQYHRELLYDEACEASKLALACKQTLREHLYRNRDILKLEIRGRKVIHDLMEIFWEAAKEYRAGDMTPKSYAGKIYLLMSDNYRRTFEERLEKGESSLYSRLQLVADQVAGMTDTHACRLHQELFNG